MIKMRAQLHGMQTQGVLFGDLRAVKKRLGSMLAFFQDEPQRFNRFGSGDAPFSVRRGSYLYYTGNSMAAEIQLLRKNRGGESYRILGWPARSLKQYVCTGRYIPLCSMIWRRSALSSGFNRFSVKRFKPAEKNGLKRFLVLRITPP